MLCQHCKCKPATVNYVEIINGDKFESHLCAECYADLYGELNSKANNDIWAGLFGCPTTKAKSCPVCGTTYADYERTGLLGCTSCYDVFKEELLPSILKIQGKVTHVGKVESNNDELGLHRKLKEYQEKLECALRDKNFAEAGRLNKKIDGIKKMLKVGGDE
jgi:protein arginine kinase activator